MPDVRMPDGTIIKNVPEGTTQAELQARLSGLDQPSTRPETPRPPSFLDTLLSVQNARRTSPVGLAEAALTLGSGAITEPAAGLAGLVGFTQGPDFAAGVVDAVRERGTFQPRTQAGQDILRGVGRVAEPIANTIGDIAAGPGAAGAPPPQPVSVLAPFALAGQTQFSPEASTAIETTLLGVPAVLGGRALARSPVAQSISSGTVAQPGSIIPTVREVFAAGRTAFDRARQLGGGVRPEALQRAATSVRNIKNDVGLKIDFDSDLHPKATRVRQRLIEDFESGQVDFDELMTLRELASDVAASADKAERFRGVILKNKIDDFVNSLDEADVLAGNPQAAAEALATARQLWRDASAARTIERHINLAGIDAGDFTGAGFENKLRIRFRQLARRIENGQERGFTPSEVRLINQVANGTFSGNIARFIGKAAPTGIVSGGIGAGVGFTLGGPLGAAAVPAAGALGRALATRSTIRNAQRALEAPLTNSLVLP